MRRDFSYGIRYAAVEEHNEESWGADLKAVGCGVGLSDSCNPGVSNLRSRMQKRKKTWGTCIP